MATIAAEIDWVCSLVVELGVKVNKPCVLWSNNLGATQLTVKEIYHTKFKHMAIVKYVWFVNPVDLITIDWKINDTSIRKNMELLESTSEIFWNLPENKVESEKNKQVREISWNVKNRTILFCPTLLLNTRLILVDT